MDSEAERFGGQGPGSGSLGEMGSLSMGCGVQCQCAAQKPPMVFDSPAFPGDTLTVQRRVAPKRWTESGSYLFHLSLPWVPTLVSQGR